MGMSTIINAELLSNINDLLITLTILYTGQRKFVTVTKICYSNQPKITNHHLSLLTNIKMTNTLTNAFVKITNALVLITKSLLLKQTLVPFVIIMNFLDHAI